MLKYKQERKASEEVLRLIIQKMAPHPAAFTPCAYAVWYEHLTGINRELSAEINKLLDSNTPLDDTTCARLHDSYISESNQDVHRILKEDIKNLLGNLINASVETDKQALTFGSNLQTFGNQLKSKPDLLALDDLVERIASDTESMHGSMNKLHSELEDSKEKVEKLQKELESARQEALNDPLTGIYNRRGFEIQVDNLFSDNASIDKGAALLMIDIDHFKKVNDTYGHLLGDKVIRTLAGTLKSLVKGQDIVARLGGEEFAILLPNTALDGAHIVAENIRTTVEHGKIKQMNSDKYVSNITVSIGIAACQRDKTLEEWIDMADKALYRSKENGRNRVTVFDNS